MKNKVKHIVIGSDANYLHKAVIYYDSLNKYFQDYILHIFCFDDITFNVFSKLNYKKVKLYHTSQFENKKLVKLRKSKDKKYEYYWAINAYITKYIIDKFEPDNVTFSDCDYMFFSSPQVIFDEVKKADILIQPNNFSYLSVNDFIPVGYYCSSFEFFRNNTNGRKALNWWHKQCMQWCSSTFENGKFGDQKYLDDWRIRFEGVREVANPGANVAPWNIQKYDVTKRNGRILLNDKWPLIYYHYHSFRMNLVNYKYIITGDRDNSYKIPNDVIENIYKPYIKTMKSTLIRLKKIKDYSDYVKINPSGEQIDNKGKIIQKYSSIYDNNEK